MMDSLKHFKAENSAKSFLTTNVVNESPRSVKQCLSLIEDPLWKDVCLFILENMDDDSVLKIWGCSLGEVPVSREFVEILYQTEEARAFLAQYSFVIVGCLRKYFPALNEIHLIAD